MGRPIANTRLYVLDENRQLLPVGVAGELYIGGAGVARGYLNRPELTRERFVRDPFAADAEARLYRTGDLVRYRSDGNLEFLGRLDDQVKLHGYRIEPGEIESVLATHAGVGAVAVVLREDAPGEKRLVAYLVAKPPQAPSLSELREHAQCSLPEYMIPAAFVVVPELPLTANGKVDRAVLPAPDGLKLAATDRYVAPRDAVEETLARIWTECLRLERVGVHSNFFALGGDSILSMQMVVRARKAGLHLAHGLVFQHQTIAELARVARPARPAAAVPQARGAVALTPIQSWFFEVEQPAPQHFNQAVMLRLAPEVDRAALARALDDTIAAHDAFRLRFVRSESGWTQHHAEVPASFDLATWDLSAVEPGQRDAEIERRASALQASLALDAGPLVRGALIEPGAGAGRRLLLTAHHLVVDAESWRILLEELDARYQCAVSGAGFAAPTTAPFQRWSEALARHASSEALLAQRDYWAAIVRAQVAALPADVDADRGTTRTSDALTTTLAAEHTTALLRQVPHAYGTHLQEVLLTALACALAELGDDARFRVDLEGHGREVEVVGADVSRTVGWFTTLYPFLLERQAGDVGATLRWMKEALRAVPARGLGYGVLRHLVGDETVRVPDAELVFNYLGQWDAAATALGQAELAADGVGQVQSLETRRRHALAVDSWIRGGRLHVRWNYTTQRYHRETIERLARAFDRALAALIEHCTTPGVGAYTPSDFELAKLDGGELAALLERVGIRSRGGIEDIYPLSPIQHGILFHGLYAPGSRAYFEQIGFSVDGPLDLDALIAAFRACVDEYAPLRTSFAWQQLRHPVQIVHGRAELPVTVHELGHLPAEARREALDALAAERRRAGFDLERAPLMRLDLVRLEPGRHHVLLSFHHLIMDGWSMARVLTEVARAYDAHRQGRPPARTAGMRYREFIAWLARQDRDRARAYWQERLRGFVAPTPLCPRAAASAEAARGPERALHERALDAASTAAIQAVARMHGLTAATIFQGAWALVLSRYSGERDIVFGTVTSGRPAALDGVDTAVGLFVATLPVRTAVDDDAPLLDWLRALQSSTAELREYEHSSLVDVQSWSDVPPGKQLFESLFVFENYPVETALRDGGLFAIDRAEAWEATSYPLDIAVLTRGDELSLRVGYDTSRFDRVTMDQLAEHYVGILAQIVERPEATLGTISMLSAGERRRLVAEWNATAVPYPTDACLHELFEAQVARTPDAIAVTCAGAAIRYRELEARANQLAHRLRSLGVGPEVLVGISLDRSIDTVVALLGVWKAGGAYVPLDPSYPPERLEYMVGDAQCAVVITQLRLRGRLAVPDAHVVYVDDPALLGDMPATRPAPSAGAQHAAYVIYTSGSTGLPKGVVGPHDAIVNRLRWMWDAFPFEPGEVGCHKTSLNFLDSVWEIFGPLLRGVPSVAIDHEAARDPFALVRTLAAHRVSRIVLVPSLLRAILDAAVALSEPLPALRYWTTSGEALPYQLANRFAEVFPHATLINLYGASELAADSTCHVVFGRAAPGPMPIGRPIANTQVYVLDRRGEPVPVGVPGELWIGGAGLARGYLGRPALTAERFVPDPFGAGRLYRTGDLARWRADGALEYLGRVDH
ncbi:MAG TPA: amino acid adenylation domain-containing protein [Kofleriaceae bacterium]|nr:amino acid adenylation domain-containing protein [Kofleriaceae bacterium]